MCARARLMFAEVFEDKHRTRARCNVIMIKKVTRCCSRSTWRHERLARKASRLVFPFQIWTWQTSSSPNVVLDLTCNLRIRMQLIRRTGGVFVNHLTVWEFPFMCNECVTGMIAGASGHYYEHWVRRSLQHSNRKNSDCYGSHPGSADNVMFPKKSYYQAIRQTQYNLKQNKHNRHTHQPGTFSSYAACGWTATMQ